MPAPKRNIPRPLGRLGEDLQGWSQLAVTGVLGIARTTEHLHRSIAKRAWPLGQGKGERTTGLTRLIYQSVRGTTRVAGWGVQQLAALLKTWPVPRQPSRHRDALVAALNGVYGDHLSLTGNSLCIPMALRVNGQPLTLERMALEQQMDAPKRRIVVLVHGLCMNDHQWTRQGHDHGQALAERLDMSALYLHYNTGLHTSTNGQALALLLEQLIKAWPVPVDEICLLGHSMGGLVSRSACHYAAQHSLAWLGRVRTMVLLGTPHHGAPTERGGHLIDTVLRLSPYLAPFARLGQARSAGITDLRYGNVQDADWQQAQGHAAGQDTRCATPLPHGVATHLIAATMSKTHKGPRSRWWGDALVPVPSALGEHADPNRVLAVPPERKTVVLAANHWDLLHRDEVYQALLKALTVPS